MQQDRSFDDLIDELRSLRIRQDDIIAELAALNNTAGRHQAANHEERNENEEQAEPAHGLRRGDRVRIKNRVRKPATAGANWSEARERLATVTRATDEQVFVTTDNGTKTWRAPNNLRLI
jgi:hypothetical protein